MRAYHYIKKKNSTRAHTPHTTHTNAVLKIHVRLLLVCKQPKTHTFSQSARPDLSRKRGREHLQSPKDDVHQLTLRALDTLSARQSNTQPLRWVQIVQAPKTTREFGFFSRPWVLLDVYIYNMYFPSTWRGFLHICTTYILPLWAPRIDKFLIPNKSHGMRCSQCDCRGMLESLVV